MPKIVISSERLQLAEPLMKKYYGYNGAIFYDDIRQCVEASGINYAITDDDGLTSYCYEEIFDKHKKLAFNVLTPYKNTIYEQFSEYFPIQDDDEEEVITEDDKVWFCLEYISCFYHKNETVSISESSYNEGFDLMYEYILRTQIYPEILSLYKMILEAKEKDYRGSKMTITYERPHKDKMKKETIKVNTYSWFIDDMEKYFAERFPHLTLDGVNELLSQYKKPVGAPSKDPNTTNLILGTYYLLRENHSRFKNSKKECISEICQFVSDYINYLNISDKLILDDIAEIIKGKKRNKTNYTPKWNSWGDFFLNIEKQPETSEERFNQLSPRYEI